MTITSWTANTLYAKGQTYQGTNGYYYVAHLNGTFTGTLATSTSVGTITGISMSGGTNFLYVGMAVTGTNIPAGTYISAITGTGYAPTSITLSQAATGSGVTVITVNGYYSGATYDIGARDTNNSSLQYYIDVSDTFGEARLKANQLSVNDAFAKPVDVVPGTSVTVNAQISKMHRLSLTASVTTFNINNLMPGEELKVYITQGAGAYTIAGWTSNTQTIKFSGGVTPTITVTASKIDQFIFRNDGNFIYVGTNQNY